MSFIIFCSELSHKKLQAVCKSSLTSLLKKACEESNGEHEIANFESAINSIDFDSLILESA